VVFFERLKNPADNFVNGVIRRGSFGTCLMDIIRAQQY